MAKFISLFAGVGGFDLGMEKAGHECVAQVEWDKNAAGVLKRRWPDVPLFCDVSKVSADDLPDADFITYGFPCQDLSVAGKREGLEGERSGLFFEATRLIRELIARGCRLEYAIAENVAGVFSADDGLALARCIRELLESGACETGWALLDSQYFGVAQRRKRVFIVSDFGGEAVDEILAITESLPGHPAPSREAGKGTAGDATKGVGEGGDVVGSLAARDYKGVGNQYFNEGKVIAQNPINLPESDIVGALSDGAHMGGGLNGQDAYTGRILAVQKAEVYDMKQRHNPQPTENVSLTTDNCAGVRGDTPLVRSKQGGEGPGADVYNGQVTGETAPTLTSATGIANASGPKVIEQKETYCLQGGGETSQSGNGLGVDKDVAFTLNGLDKHGVAYEQEGIAFEPKSLDDPPRVTGDIKKVVSPSLNCMTGGGREPAVVSWNGDETPKTSEDVSLTLRAQQGGEGVGVAFTASDRSNKAAWEGEISGTINCQMNSESSNLQMGVRENLTVRRLTPIECERLQGFPDNWTSEKMELTLEGNEWKATGKVVKQADGPRYKQLGNAVTVNVAEYLGKQIAKTL